ncbi:MAG: 23S rRNA (pseudouridine(1915)-N(3))-methyltransferase RlmH [Clostridiaceae bacterium]|nr:23S rRNA (pseudouridine(1915)-N(3))-methyltransferase RlmH [Clostridiaceae bacterium]
MIRIICIGKMKEKGMKSLEQDYVKRIQRFNKCEIIELKEANSSYDQDKIIKDESERLLKAVRNDEYLILFDIKSKQMDSCAFASVLAKAGSKIAVVIGGSIGFNDQVRKRANKIISLSEMTFPHLLARIMILEQVYRSYKILNNQKYHK